MSTEGSQEDGQRGGGDQTLPAPGPATLPSAEGSQQGRGRPRNWTQGQRGREGLPARFSSRDQDQAETPPPMQGWEEALGGVSEEGVL